MPCAHVEISIGLYFISRKMYYSNVLKIRFEKGRIQDMKNWVILILLGIFLATTMAGCKKGG
jgi:hypothetical protein